MSKPKPKPKPIPPAPPPVPDKIEHHPPKIGSTNTK